MKPPITIGVIAGEVSGDLLGEDLIAALKRQYEGEVRLIGVGGDALRAEGLVSLFDYSELSIMGFTQVLARLPYLLRRIRQTADLMIRERPDALLLVDSPDFTLRVAKRVRAARPDIPIVKYVSPSVWAWKEHRAPAMRAYVDHVLALLPFEPEVMARLKGPETTFVGHRLVGSPDVLDVRARRTLTAPEGKPRTILLLPGSRGGEVRRLLPLFRGVAESFVERNGPTEFLLPTVPRMESLVRAFVDDWPIKPEVSAETDFKWAAFVRADAALAASGTVILELGLCGVPTVSVYRTDWLIKLITDRIKIWSAALPNLIADFAVVPEFFNEQIRTAMLTRWLERLSAETPERVAMLDGFSTVWNRMQTPEPPGEAGARILLRHIQRKTRP